jgi:hypothetical protein
MLLKAVSLYDSLSLRHRVAPREPGPPPPPDRARTSHATDRSLSFSPVSVSLHRHVSQPRTSAWSSRTACGSSSRPKYATAARGANIPGSA